MAKNQKTKLPKGAWFIPRRGSYLPVSWQAWLTYFPFTGYLLFALYYGFHHTVSFEQGILFVIPNWIAALVIMTWLAKAKS